MTDIYERLADENEPAPATAPIAQLTGDQASELMASLMAEDSDATAILAAMAGPGRPTANEKREKSVQERFRVPVSWSSYIEHAAIRDVFNNKSKYLKALIIQDARAHHEEHRLRAV